METISEPEPIVAARDRLGESVLWVPTEQAVYWVDFYGPTLRRFAPATGQRRDWILPGIETVGSAVAVRGGHFLVAHSFGISLFNPRTTGMMPFSNPNGGRSGIGYNDAKIDRDGRYWVGTYDTGETEPRGVLYRVDADGAWSLAETGYVVCNGPAFSPDNQVLYLSDTVGRRLVAYRLDASTGRLDERRTLAVLRPDEGCPDGITVDAQGYLWCAHYGGARVTRFAPDGRRDRVIMLPVPNVTSCCFGGADLTTLFVTTAAPDKPDAQAHLAPLSGALFAIETGIRGLPEREFEPL